MNIAIRLYCLLAMVLLTWNCQGQSEGSNKNEVSKIETQFGLGLFETFGSQTTYVYGDFVKIDILYTPSSLKVNNFIEPFFGITLIGSESYYRNFVAAVDSYTNYFSSFQSTSAGVVVGIKSSLNFGSFSFISKQLIDTRTAVTRSHSSSSQYTSFLFGESIRDELDKPDLRSMLVYFHMQLGLTYKTKRNRSIHLLISGGRSINSFAPKLGFFNDPIAPSTLFPWEFSAMLGVTTPLKNSF